MSEWARDRVSSKLVNFIFLPPRRWQWQAKRLFLLDQRFPPSISWSRTKSLAERLVSRWGGIDVSDGCEQRKIGQTRLKIEQE
jgi:hypothetical protein